VKFFSRVAGGDRRLGDNSTAKHLMILNRMWRKMNVDALMIWQYRRMVEPFQSRHLQMR
jgi:hypothetical protein